MTFKHLPALVCAAFLTAFVADTAHAKNACSNAIQGKIAWNYSGSTSWNQSNIDDICRGAEDETGPAKCFQETMHGGVKYRGNAKWSWEDAAKLCKGAVSAQRRISCFVGMAASDRNRAEAISACGRIGGGNEINTGPVVLEGGIIPRYEAPKPTTLKLKQDGVYLANWNVQMTIPGYLPAELLTGHSITKGTTRSVEIPADATIVRVKATMVGIGTPVIVNQDVRKYGCVILTGSVFSQDWDWKESC